MLRTGLTGQDWTHRVGPDSQGRTGLSGQDWTHRVGPDSQGRTGLRGQDRTHRAGQDSQGRTGLTGQASQRAGPGLPLKDEKACCSHEAVQWDRPGSRQRA